MAKKAKAVNLDDVIAHLKENKDLTGLLMCRPLVRESHPDIINRALSQHSSLEQIIGELKAARESGVILRDQVDVSVPGKSGLDENAAFELERAIHALESIEGLQHGLHDLSEAEQEDRAPAKKEDPGLSAAEPMPGEVPESTSSLGEVNDALQLANSCRRLAIGLVRDAEAASQKFAFQLGRIEVEARCISKKPAAEGKKGMGRIEERIFRDWSSRLAPLLTQSRTAVDVHQKAHAAMQGLAGLKAGIPLIAAVAADVLLLDKDMLVRINTRLHDITRYPARTLKSAQEDGRRDEISFLADTAEHAGEECSKLQKLCAEFLQEFSQGVR